MTHGSIVTRLVRGTRWMWRSEDYLSALPDDLDATVMDLPVTDRLHAKQGRSTARVRFDSPRGPLSVYLKRHVRLPWKARLRALIDPGGRHSPASAEWEHLARARSLGLRVPVAVAAGEWIGPWGRLQSFLMVAELTGCRELNEALPEMAASLPPDRFAALKRELVAEMAAMTVTLHSAGLFHKDLYLCHFFVDHSPSVRAGRRLTLIDLHRLGEHRWTGPRWRWKDLGQLLYSSYGVPGINDRDRLRFWALYRRRMCLAAPRLQLRIVRAKAERYRVHNGDPN